METVYAQGSEAALLMSSVDRALTGDDEDVPLTDRAAFRSALDESSPAAMIESFVGALTLVADRAGGLLIAFEDAAGSDAAIAELWAAAEQRLRVDYRRLVVAVTAAGPLPAGWDVETATDAMWATFPPRLAHTLVRSLAWPRERTVAWVSTTVTALLLPTDDRKHE
ncbi:hypothetical protein [Modestobacter sp. DSM 44400]|uniref:hypothetical protein n=1 Tax=Modestobacter sp. DSM 44400 TaxID=1550230 RepID=UPI0011151A74|nr:hypothetical protein [Modestobacter sp. DSM 44400]